MPKSTSSFTTDRASRYLQAMCKHFAHKVEVGYDRERGWAAMPYGSLKMHTGDGSLHFEIEAADEVMLERMKAVIDAHIVRFAFREKLERLEWK
jgi:hypothetical protein